MNHSPSIASSTTLAARKIFVSLDTTARSKGSDKVASQVEKILGSKPDLAATLVRNGSRGMFWLEPLLEINTAKGRVAYGPVKPEDVNDIINQQCFDGAVEHPLCLGFTEELPWFKSQQRLTFARVGIIDPIDVDDYISHGGFVGLTNALAKTAQQIVDEVKDSGLRGRGGAAFPTGNRAPGSG